jgi:hypothetical protein
VPRNDDDHLTPELFVDVLEKSPVEASRRHHLERCPRCAAELRELEATLGLLKGESRPRARRRYAAWIAAATVLFALSFLFRASAPEPVRPAETELLLPPAELDEDFQLLVALSREIGESGTAEALANSGAVAAPELSELTEDERARIVEHLAQEALTMESSS